MLLVFFLSMLLFSFVSYAADGSGIPFSSPFYIRPAVAAIRVATAAAPPVADDDDAAADDNDDVDDKYHYTIHRSFFIGFWNQFCLYQLVP